MFRLALANTELILTYTKLDDRIPLLMYTIRAWAKYNNLTGRNSFQMTSYALTLMVLHYLQHITPPVVPCLQLCHDVTDLIGLWDCGFCKHEQVNTNKSSSGKYRKVKNVFIYLS